MPRVTITQGERVPCAWCRSSPQGSRSWAMPSIELSQRPVGERTPWTSNSKPSALIRSRHQAVGQTGDQHQEPGIDQQEEAGHPRLAAPQQGGGGDVIAGVFAVLEQEVGSREQAEGGEVPMHTRLLRGAGPEQVDDDAGDEHPGKEDEECMEARESIRRALPIIVDRRIAVPGAPARSSWPGAAGLELGGGNAAHAATSAAQASSTCSFGCMTRCPRWMYTACSAMATAMSAICSR